MDTWPSISVALPESAGDPEPPGTGCSSGLRNGTDSPVMILAANPDGIVLDFVVEIAKSLWREAHVCRATSVREIRHHAALHQPHLIVTDVAFADGDAFSELRRRSGTEPTAPRLVLLTRWCDPRTAELAQSVNANAAVHLSGASKETVSAAILAAHRGSFCWCPAFRAALSHESQAAHLTANEKLILTVLGDGSDDRTAAEHLGISPASVLTVRRELHRKLKIQHRGELIRTAANLGYVRFMGGRVIRVGFDTMLRTRNSRVRRAPLGNS